MGLEEAIKILKEFKNTGYHTLMAKYNWDRIKANTMIEIAIEVVLNHITKQEKMIDKMAKALHLFIWKNDEKIMITSKPKVSCQTLSIEDIKQYFEKKVEESE